MYLTKLCVEYLGLLFWPTLYNPTISLNESDDILAALGVSPLRVRVPRVLSAGKNALHVANVSQTLITTGCMEQKADIYFYQPHSVA